MSADVDLYVAAPGQCQHCGSIAQLVVVNPGLLTGAVAHLAGCPCIRPAVAA